MTLVWLLVGLSLGLAAGANIAYRIMIRRYDIHGYCQVEAIVPIEPVVDHITAEHSLVEIYDEATHCRRLHDVWRENATDLTRDLIAARRELARLQRGDGPVPVYGIHRQQQAVR